MADETSIEEKGSRLRLGMTSVLLRLPFMKLVYNVGIGIAA